MKSNEHAHYVELVKTNAKEIDKALMDASRAMAVLAAYGIVGVHESMALITKWSWNTEAWINSRLTPAEAEVLIDELCEEDHP